MSAAQREHEDATGSEGMRDEGQQSAARPGGDHHEVIVVGGGMVGAALAALLGEAGVAVALVDARPALLDPEAVGRGRPARRVSALTPVSQRLLEGLGAWPWMAARRVSPYRYMQVWDAEGSGEVDFSADQAGLAVLGHIVENDVTLAALERRLVALPSVHLCLGPGSKGWRAASGNGASCWPTAGA